MSRLHSPRAGMTLIEILVSILILSVVSIAMIGILMVSSELFRRGEFSRSSNDEAIAVVGALDDDLKRVIPVVDGGWLYAGLSVTGNGNCILGMAIPNPDPSGISSTGTNGRLAVAWFVDAQDNLVRVQRELTTAGSPPGNTVEVQLLSDVDAAIAAGGAGTSMAASPTPTQAQIVTTGCLHFGTWLSLDDPAYPNLRRVHDAAKGIDWEDSTCDPFADAAIAANGGAAGGYFTSPGIPITTTLAGGGSTTVLKNAFAMPAAIRISVVLTGGGRFAPKGILTAPLTGTQVAISGVAVLPTTPGSMLRIDPDPSGPPAATASEWLEYSNYSGGKATITRRGARRTSATASHAKGDLVRIGVTYSLVRSLPR